VLHSSCNLTTARHCVYVVSLQRSQSDASNRRRSSRKAKGRASSSSQSPEPDQDSRSGSESLPPPTEPVSGKKVKGRASGAKKSSASGSAERRTPSTAHDNKTKDLDPSRAEGDVEGSDVNDLAGDDMAMSPPPQPVPPPSAATKSGGRTAMRSAVSSVTAKKAGASAAAAGAKPTDDDVTDVRCFCGCCVLCKYILADYCRPILSSRYAMVTVVGRLSVPWSYLED